MSNKNEEIEISEIESLEKITARRDDIKESIKDSSKTGKNEEALRLEAKFNVDISEKVEQKRDDEKDTREIEQNFVETFYGSFDTGYKLDYESLFGYLEGINVSSGFITYTETEDSNKTASDNSHDIERGFDCKIMDDFVKVSRMDAMMGISNGFIDPNVRELHSILNKTSMYAALLMVKYTLFSS